MKNDFYTLGGGRFWEDVFFYQKWRIQRNHISKTYRLLDNWDIRRHEGTFEECQKAFMTYVEAYEIPKPSGHMIVMIHSLGQSKNIFKPMWRRALKDGYMAAALNYPSTQKDLDLHVKQFKFFFKYLEGVDTVSFVTLGVGNTIIQELFKSDENLPSYLTFKRCVFINPIVTGSNLLEKLCKNKLANFIIGPMGKDLTTQNINKLVPLSKIETGVIMTSQSFWIKLLKLLTFTDDKTISDKEIRNFTGAIDSIKISNKKTNIFKNNKISDAVMNFLINGNF